MVFLFHIRGFMDSKGGLSMLRRIGFLCTLLLLLMLSGCGNKAKSLKAEHPLSGDEACKFIEDKLWERTGEHLLVRVEATGEYIAHVGDSGTIDGSYVGGYDMPVEGGHKYSLTISSRDTKYQGYALYWDSYTIYYKSSFRDSEEIAPYYFISFDMPFLYYFQADAENLLKKCCDSERCFAVQNKAQKREFTFYLLDSSYPDNKDYLKKCLQEVNELVADYRKEPVDITYRVFLTTDSRVFEKADINRKEAASVEGFRQIGTEGASIGEETGS